MEPQPTEPPGLASQPRHDLAHSCLTPDTSPSSSPSPPSSESDTSQPRPPGSPAATRHVNILARRLSHHNLLGQQDSSAEMPSPATSPTPVANSSQHLAAGESSVHTSDYSDAPPVRFPPHHGSYSSSLDAASSQWLLSHWLETRLHSRPSAESHVHQQAPRFHLTPTGPKQTIVADENLDERPIIDSHGTICPGSPVDVDEGIGEDMDSEPLLPPIALADLRSARQARFSGSATPADNIMRRRDLVYKAPRMRKRSSKKRTRDAASPSGGNSEQDVKRLRADPVA